VIVGNLCANNSWWHAIYIYEGNIATYIALITAPSTLTKTQIGRIFSRKGFWARVTEHGSPHDLVNTVVTRFVSVGIGLNHASFAAGFRSTYFWDYSLDLLTRSLQQWQHVQNTSTFQFGTVNFWDTIRNLPDDPALGDQGSGGGGG
jgi:hypothetical protein